MAAPSHRILRMLAVVALTTAVVGFAATEVGAQPGAGKKDKGDAKKAEPKKADPPQPKKDPNPGPPPNFRPNPQPAPQPAPQPHPFARTNPVQVLPSINSFPGYPSQMYNQAAYGPMLYNPALYNPWMNPVTYNPFPVNPLAMNPFFNNPFAINPLLANPGFNPNPFGVPGYRPFVNSTPPIAMQQPGFFQYKGPDKQVNPWSGTVYHPISGTVKFADGSTFYRVPGSGTPIGFNEIAPGSELYYNPQGGTFFNPRSGVVSKPGQTNVFLPYVW